MATDKSMNLTQLFTALDEEMMRHRELERQEQTARSNLTACVNCINDLHKQIDATIETARTAAPWNTHWYSQRNKGQPA